MTRVLVTGGSGFIGSHLIDDLCAHGHSIASLDIREPSRRVAGVDYVPLDFCLHDSLRRFLDRSKPDVVVHLGALPSIRQSVVEPFTSMTANIAGTYSVLDGSRLCGARRVVFASSAAVYGRTAFRHAGQSLSEDMPLEPLNPYSLAKKAGEEMMRLWATGGLWAGLDTVSLRFFNVFGPRQPRESAYATCIERFIGQKLEGEPFTIVPDGNQRRDLVYVGDVVRAIRLAVEKTGDFDGAAINIGGGRNYSVLDIAGAIGGPDHPRVFIEPRPGEIRESLADVRRADALLGWRPHVSFDVGLREVMAAAQEARREQA